MVKELDWVLDNKSKDKADIPHVISRGTVILIVGIFSMIVVSVIFYFRPNKLQPGERAPQFLLISFAGESFALESLRGQVIVLNFWANWCPPCHAEAPDLQDIYEEYADEDVLLLGINYLDVQTDALGFIERYGITYPNGPDIAERIAKTYNLHNAPETIIIGRDGKITHLFIGQVNYEMLSAALDSLVVREAQ